MKKGEKAAIWVALTAVASLIGIAFYYESTSGGIDETKYARLADENTSSSNSQPVWVIPKGVNPDALPEAQGPGAKAITLYCVQCHDLPPPAMHTATEWAAVLNRMRGYMQDRRGGMLARLIMPSEQDWTIIGSYLAHHAQKPMDATRYSDLQSPEGQAFIATCSQCHAAPDPQQHTTKEWPRIVLRMKQNMSAAGIKQPDDQTTDLIVTFLQRHGTKTPG